MMGDCATVAGSRTQNSNASSLPALLPWLAGLTGELPRVAKLQQEGGIEVIGIFSRVAVILGLQLGARDKAVSAAR